MCIVYNDQQIPVMNRYPIIEMLAFYSRYQRLAKPEWRAEYTMQLKRVRSCHSLNDGGVKTSCYSVETRSGEILNLIYEEESLLWRLQPCEAYPSHVVDRVLALVQRHKHAPSRAHRIIPYRFEIIPEEQAIRSGREPELPLVQRVQPWRFQSGNIPSSQVTHIVTRHMENVMVTKHLHYVVETDQRRFFHLVYILDQSDWRLMQEVDEEFFFVR
jgi:hypothetical protein